MRILFEVSDLAVASPATVSRCGMVYMEPGSISWESYVSSWMDEKIDDWHNDTKKHLWLLMNRIIDKALTLIRERLK